jgi:alpha-galactosidase
MSTTSKGHAGHTKAADSKGLAGHFLRPVKVTMLGAGSFFTRQLVNDLIRTPGNRGGTIALVDIDQRRLDLALRVTRKQIAAAGAEGWEAVASADRLDALPGTDYIVSCIEVSGVACVRADNDIPAKYGVDQCIGDTLGPGGLFKGLRTIPTWLAVLRDAERLCPGAIVLNYTNPMSMLCLAAGRASSMSVVGLCHSVQGTSHLLADRAGVPYEELDWECAGINHFAWFTTLVHRGRDLYPQLKEQARADLAGHPAKADDAQDLIRKDMMLQFGAFITESSGHLSEYLPYYRKRKDLLARYCRDGYEGGTGFYANNWPRWRERVDREQHEILTGGRALETERTWEYASWIIEAREKDAPYRVHGNVMNHAGAGGGRLISNLMDDGCVEVACLVDGNGVQPTRYGRLPAQMAALCASNMRYFDLAATAAIERSKEAAIHALMLDPLTAAVCSPEEIRRMALELFDTQAEFLPGYR